MSNDKSDSRGMSPASATDRSANEPDKNEAPMARDSDISAAVPSLTRTMTGPAADISRSNTRDPRGRQTAALSSARSDIRDSGATVQRSATRISLDTHTRDLLFPSGTDLSKQLSERDVQKLLNVQTKATEPSTTAVIVFWVVVLGAIAAALKWFGLF